MPDKRRTPARRTLSPDEMQLWEGLVRDAQALRPKRITRQAALPEPSEPIPAPTPAKATPSALTPELKLPSTMIADIYATMGDYRNLDGNTAKKLRTGKREIDAKLDLHGLSQMRAHHQLTQFILKAHERQHRTLLVITGKGRNRSEKGVLQGALPGWLGEPPLAPLVLAFDYAQPKDGGTGAYYILLRRQRA